MNSTNPAHRIIDNLNKKKFTTNIDDEADRERQRNEELSRRKNVTNAEPFWQDFNSTITDICKQREEHPTNRSINKANKRQRGPSQPTLRNNSKKGMSMHQTMQNFKMGHGQVDSEGGMGIVGSAATT